MADLTPGMVAKIDQIHAAITDKLAELVSSAVDGIRQEGEAVTASALAGTAYGTDHNSVATLLAAALIRLARHQMRDQRRSEGELHPWVSVRRQRGFDTWSFACLTCTDLDGTGYVSDIPTAEEAFRRASAHVTRHHTEPEVSPDGHVG